MSNAINIQYKGTNITDCETVIIVPEIAVQEAGYIKSFTIKNGAHAKHEYHALAQMAYFQFQDDELEIIEVDSPVKVVSSTEVCEVDRGMILYRQIDGSFHVLIHALQNSKKLLETTYRYCTRWVRLDI